MRNCLTPLLVIVTGLPCTGKTALARRLSEETGLPLVAKDAIKENLFDSLGWSDKAWSMKLGLASVRLLYQMVEMLLARGISTIAESYFHPDLARPDLLAIQARAPFRPFVIDCVADGEVIWERWQRRIASGERHPGHVDDSYPEAAEKALRYGKAIPLDLGGMYRVVDTNDYEKVSITELVDELNAASET